MRATVVHRRPLRYDAGADPALDRPPHVRAASALLRLDDALVVVQDDAHWFAVLHEGGVEAVPLPRGPGGLRLFGDDRGNKRHKLDLEAALTLPGRIVALGSGSTPARERAVVLPWPSGRPEVVPLPDLYAALRAAFPGAELNIEGAFPVDGVVRLLQRGNGIGAVNATVDVALDWFEAALAGHRSAPDLRIRRWDLGHLLGAPLTFTDGIADAHGWWFLAAAEDSPDATRDGPVTGSVLGRVRDGVVCAPLEDERGPIVVKAEGLALGDRPDEILIVNDADDPELPSELLTVRVSG